MSASRSASTIARRFNCKVMVEIDDKSRHLYGMLAFAFAPIPVKWALHKMVVIGQNICLPLLSLSERHHKTSEQGLKQTGLA